MNKIHVLIVVITLTLLTPIGLFASYAQSRILVPTIFGVSCGADRICMEDESRRQEATQLVEQAITELEPVLDTLHYAPRIIFCSTQQCFERFGFTQAAAQTVGQAGTVVAPRGWTDYYIKHELIHHWQAQELGLIELTQSPMWIREGMAYALSDDPRRTLTKPWETYRTQFEAWYANQTGDALFDELKQELDT